MSGRLLDFKAYIGGADNVQVIELFPSNQKNYTYNFGGVDVSGYTFKIDYQTLVLDTVSYNNITGEPNFTDTTVLGYFPTVTTETGNTYIDTSAAASGLVGITIPDDRYTGQLLPNARANVACTVLSVEWTTDDTPPQTDLHRWAILERWEPEVTPGDPTAEASAQGGFTAL